MQAIMRAQRELQSQESSLNMVDINDDKQKNNFHKYEILIGSLRSKPEVLSGQLLISRTEPESLYLSGLPIN